MNSLVIRKDGTMFFAHVPRLNRLEYDVILPEIRTAESYKEMADMPSPKHIHVGFIYQTHNMGVYGEI